MSIVIHLDKVPALEDICGQIQPVTTKADFNGANVVFWTAKQASTPHYHKIATEFYIVVEGTGKVRLGEKMINVRPGTVVMIRPGTVHHVVPDAGQVIKAWVVASPAWQEADQVRLD